MPDSWLLKTNKVPEWRLPAGRQGIGADSQAIEK